MGASLATAIPRLRRFILDLAVRGKLVPQDPNDEPASELLQRIQAKKSKRGTLELHLADNELVYELPVGWCTARFEDVFTLEYGDNLPSEKRSNTGEYPVYGSNGMVGSHFACFVHSPCIIIGRKGSAGALNLSLTNGCWVTDVAYFCVPPSGIDLLFSFRMFHTLGLDTLGKGVKPGLNRNEVYMLPIALPSLAEQRRIVDKVDELMALCGRLEAAQTEREIRRDRLTAASLQCLNQATEAPALREHARFYVNHLPRLATRPKHIRQLRQTILNLAVRGKLVPQDPHDEPASELLQRIGAERIESEPFCIPTSWAWVCVGKNSDARLGKMLDKEKNKGNPKRYLRNINVRWFDFDLSNVFEMRFEDSELNEFKLRSGDVLICEGGEPGRAAVWDDREKNIYFQKAIHRVRFTDDISPHFFLITLRESVDSGRLSTYFTGVGIKHLTGKGLNSFAFPLPPLAEQQRIVAKVDELMALCDRLEAQLTTTQIESQRLLEALLHQALTP